MHIGKDRFLLLFFAGLMLVVIAMPIEKSKTEDGAAKKKEQEAA